MPDLNALTTGYKIGYSSGPYCKDLSSGWGFYNSSNTLLASLSSTGVFTATEDLIAGASSKVQFSGGTQLTANGDGGLYIKDSSGTAIFTFGGDGSFATSGTILGTGITSSTTLGAKSATLSTGTITTSQPVVSGTQTWNASGVTFEADTIDVTNTASASGSLLWNRKVGGTSMGKLDKAGTLTTVNHLNTGYALFGSASSGIGVSYNSGGQLDAAGTNARLALGLNVASIDVTLLRDGADALALRRGTNAQKFIWSYSSTNSSNYQQGALRTGSTYIEVAAETAGTGADDIDVRLTPAGTGKVCFGDHSAIAAETVTGYITIKDSGGTSRKIAVVS